MSLSSLSFTTSSLLSVLNCVNWEDHIKLIILWWSDQQFNQQLQEFNKALNGSDSIIRVIIIILIWWSWRMVSVVMEELSSWRSSSRLRSWRRNFAHPPRSWRTSCGVWCASSPSRLPRCCSVSTPSVRNAWAAGTVKVGADRRGFHALPVASEHLYLTRITSPACPVTSRWDVHILCIMFSEATRKHKLKARLHVPSKSPVLIFLTLRINRTRGLHSTHF